MLCCTIPFLFFTVIEKCLSMVKIPNLTQILVKSNWIDVYKYNLMAPSCWFQIGGELEIH